MGWQPTRLTRAQLEERRLAAGQLLRTKRRSQAAIAREFGVSRAAVTRWKQRLAAAGLRGLRCRRPSGRPSRLTPAQWRQLLRLLDRGALAAGFETERWTQRRIAAIIARTFGVRYHFRSLGRALRARGWSPQVPVAQAKERDDALVEAWLRRDWPRIKRGLVAQGVPLPSWTRRVTRFGPASAPPGRPKDGHPSCAA
jgi:putative transposase